MKNTLDIGKVYHRFEALPSTNDFARDLAAKSKPPEGTVVRADSQSAGRGQFGSRWESEASKNLTLSVIFYPTFLKIPEQFRLSEAVALAVFDTVAELLFPSKVFENQALGESAKTEGEPGNPNPSPLKIKWPNDLYLDDGKVAGILIQNSIAGEAIQSSVVGIGLNVNQLVFRSDAPNPVSLASFSGRLHDLDEVADVLFKNLKIRYLQLKNGGPAANILTEGYRQNLYRLNQKTWFENNESPRKTFSGTIRGVTAAGQLRVDLDDGQEAAFGLREIRFAVPPK